MMALPTPIVERCIGRIDPGRPLFFSALAKRTFDIKNGVAQPSENQEPFCEQEEADNADAGNPGPVRRVPEIIPDRDFCDVIVFATARSPRPVTSAEMLFSAPGISRRLRITGDRVVDGAPGRWRFSPPEPWQEMPLGWDRAYGGIDRGVLPDTSNAESALRALVCHPGAYPRNDVGRGFCLKGSHLPSAGMPLPNVEDAKDLLAPDRFECPGPHFWHLQPMPAGFGCMPAHWFLRSVCLGVVPGEWPRLDVGVLREEELGLLPRGFVQAQRKAGLAGAALSPLFFQVSAPGMRGKLQGNERLALQGIQGGRTATLDLPGAAPRMALQTPSGELVLNPRLSQVLWDVDQGRLTMIWSAGVPLADQRLSRIAEEDLLALAIRAT